MEHKEAKESMETLIAAAASCLANRTKAAVFEARLAAKPGRTFNAALWMLRCAIGLKKTPFTAGMLGVLGRAAFVPASARRYVMTHPELAWRLSDYGAYGIPLFGYFVPGYATMDPVHRACARACILAGEVGSGFSVMTGERVLVKPTGDEEVKEVERLVCDRDVDLGLPGITRAHSLFAALDRASNSVKPQSPAVLRETSPWIPPIVLEPLLNYVESKGGNKFFVPAFCPTLQDVFVLANEIFDHDFDEAVDDCADNYVATVFRDPACPVEGVAEINRAFLHAVLLADEGTKNIGTGDVPETLLFPDDLDEPCAAAAVLASRVCPPDERVKAAIGRACDTVMPLAGFPLDDTVEAEAEMTLSERDDLYVYGYLVLETLVKRLATAHGFRLDVVPRLTPTHVAMVAGQRSSLYDFALLMHADSLDEPDTPPEGDRKRVRRADV